MFLKQCARMNSTLSGLNSIYKSRGEFKTGIKSNYN